MRPPTFKKAVGSLGTGFGHFPVGNRSAYGNFGVACQNLENPRDLRIGSLDARIGSPEAIRIMDELDAWTPESSRIIREIEAWGPELEFQKSFKKAVGSLGTGFGHFPEGNRSPYGNFGVADQNLKNPRH